MAGSIILSHSLVNSAYSVLPSLEGMKGCAEGRSPNGTLVGVLLATAFPKVIDVCAAGAVHNSTGNATCTHVRHETELGMALRSGPRTINHIYERQPFGWFVCERQVPCHSLRDKGSSRIATEKIRFGSLQTLGAHNT